MTKMCIRDRFIQNVFEFNDIMAGTIATHRTDVTILWMSDDVKEWEMCIRDRNTVSKQLVALRSSASDNRLLRLYQNGSKTPENQGFPGFYCI